MAVLSIPACARRSIERVLATEFVARASKLASNLRRSANSIAFSNSRLIYETGERRMFRQSISRCIVIAKGERERESIRFAAIVDTLRNESQPRRGPHWASDVTHRMSKQGALRSVFPHRFANWITLALGEPTAAPSKFWRFSALPCIIAPRLRRF